MVVGWNAEFEKAFRSSIGKKVNPTEFTNNIQVPDGAHATDFVLAVWPDGSSTEVPDMTVAEWEALENAAGKSGNCGALWTGTCKDGRKLTLAKRKIEGVQAVILELGKTKTQGKGQLGQVLAKHVNDDMEFAVDMCKALGEKFCKGEITKAEFKVLKAERIAEYLHSAKKTDKSGDKTKDEHNTKRVAWAEPLVTGGHKKKAKKEPSASAASSSTSKAEQFFVDMMNESPPM